MTPHKSLLVCTSPRSGSHWLCSLLWQTGVAGFPDEYFNKKTEGFYERVLGKGVMNAYSMVFDAILRLGSTSNRVFSAKLFWTDLAYIEQRFHASGSFPTSNAEKILNVLLCNISIIRLVRKDRLRQAISLYRASSTGLWSSLQEEGSRPRTSLIYDRFGISTAFSLLEEWERSWDLFLDRMHVSCLVISYEDLSTNFELVLGDVLAFVGADCGPSAIRERSCFEIQRDHVTDEWAARYLNESSL